MSTAGERLETIKRNYDDAANNEPLDLAAAKTAADVTAIQANVASASAVYFAAIAADLSADGATVESAHEGAKDAQQTVANARAASEQIPQLIGKLASSTAAARKLLDAAKKI